MTDKNMACAFTGHRPQYLPWRGGEDDPRCLEFKQITEKRIQKFINDGVTYFLSGMALGFDIYAAEAVIKLKRDNPGAALECVIPFDGQESRWSESDKARYYSILGRCNKKTVICRDYAKSCYAERNRYLVDNSGFLFAALSKSEGGTAYTVGYAVKKNRRVIKINPETNEIIENDEPIQINLF